MGLEGTGAYIRAVGRASPDYRIHQDQALLHVRERYGSELSDRSLSLLEKFFTHPSIRQRRFAITDPAELFDEDPDERMERFRRSAVELSARAAEQALARAQCRPETVDAIVVNTCTGYLCPGITSYLIEELGLPRDISAYDLVGSGCGGAVPNLEMSRRLHRAGATLSVSVEICSATYQMSDEISLLVSNALFADGAAAAVLESGPPGLELVDSRSLHEPRYRDDIRYIYRDGQLHNQLSVTLPAKSARVVRRLVEGFLEDRDMEAADITHWALHPGGQKVIDRLGELIGLPEEKLAPTRRVLREYGNISSVSVWFVLHDILAAGMEPGELCAMVAFGAGLSAHVTLLRLTGQKGVTGLRG